MIGARTIGVSLRTAARLRARSVEIEDPGDLLDHLGPGGFAFFDGDQQFVTAGAAVEVQPGDAQPVLASIAHDADPNVSPAAGPRAVGALPFASRGRLFVPARIVARDADGRTWQTVVDGIDEPPPLHVAAPTPQRFEVVARTDQPAWEEMVRAALDLIDAGALAKVVLAREVDVIADRPYDVRTVAATLRHAQPGCVVYADGGFVGASPELLVRRTGADIVSRPIAGTGDDAALLLASTKDAWEHRVVIDAVVDALREVCDDVRATGPTTMALADVTHLATTITGRVRDRATSALDVAQRLHPTPAVGGWPTARALGAIRTLEPADRGRYAGPCGWVDARGDGVFVVALRGALLDGATARLHAGAGIVAGSDPAAEWAETRAKLAPMLHALIRP